MIDYTKGFLKDLNNLIAEGVFSKLNNNESAYTNKEELNSFVVKQYKDMGNYQAKLVPSKTTPDQVQMYIRTDGYYEYIRLSSPETKQLKIDHQNKEVLYNHLIVNDIKDYIIEDFCGNSYIPSFMIGELPNIEN